MYTDSQCKRGGATHSRVSLRVNVIDGGAR